MRTRWRLAVSLGLGAILLLSCGFRARDRNVFAGTNPQSIPVATFYDPDGVVGDNFGYSVALSGDGSTVLIGADGTSESGMSDVGKAYIYTRSNDAWATNPIATFVDPALQQSDAFGGILALSWDGNTALVGSNSGVVYIYNRSNGSWTASPSAVLSDPSSGNSGLLGDFFGSSIAVSGDGTTALVGASGASANGISQAGKAYIFTEVNGIWSQAPEAVFAEPGPVTDDRFGNYVALSVNDTVALIGTASLWNPGRAFIFTKVNGIWNTTPVATVDLPGNSNEIFSSGALSANGELALIGSTGVDGGLGAV